MGIADTIVAKSDQQNADDYVGGPKTFTVAEVRVIGGDQPVEVHLVEAPGKPFKPCKTMRRVLVGVWGEDETQYVGRRLTLYNEPTVTWAGQAVGGIRISHMSHMTAPYKRALTERKGAKKVYEVKPLPDAAPPTAPALDIDTATDVAALKAVWRGADEATRARIEARVAELKAQEPAS